MRNGMIINTNTGRISKVNCPKKFFKDSLTPLASSCPAYRRQAQAVMNIPLHNTQNQSPPKGARGKHDFGITSHGTAIASFARSVMPVSETDCRIYAKAYAKPGGCAPVLNISATLSRTLRTLADGRRTPYGDSCNHRFHQLISEHRKNFGRCDESHPPVQCHSHPASSLCAVLSQVTIASLLAQAFSQTLHSVQRSAPCCSPQ